MSSAISLPLMDRVGVASPCHARWEDMTGNERVRHCAGCNLRVHNISAMTRNDAEALLQASAGDRLCIRLYRRADGTILTQDCPVGLARVRAAARRALVKVAALIGLVGVAGVAAAGTSQGLWGGQVRLRALKPFSVLCDWIAPNVPPPPPATTRGWTGGVMFMPTPVPTPTPSATRGSAGTGPTSPPAPKCD